jgi:transposase InsO family protein
VHGLLTVQSQWGHYYWVTIIDNFLHFPALYFLKCKSDVFDVFRKYKAWAENTMGCHIGVLRDNKGGEYMSSMFNSFLAGAGIMWEHTIWDTPQQNGVAERMNWSISDGIVTFVA